MLNIKLRLGFLLKFAKKHWKLLLILGVIFGGLSFWRYQKNKASHQDLQFVSPQRQNLTKYLESSGKVEAKEKARLRFIAGGKVVYIGAQEGEWVEKWQTIATIDQATLQKQLQKDLNLYMQERWDWEETQDDIRYRALDTTERRTVDQSQWDLDNTVLDVEIRDISIKNTVLSSPFSGILTHSPTAVAGVQVLSTDYFEVVNPASLVFRAEVDEADISLVKPGQKTEIVLDAYPDDTIETYVSYVSYTSTQSTSGTVFVIEMPISASDLEYFRIGMNGDVKLVLDTRNDVLSIPIETTRQEDDKTVVDVKTEGENYETREIETDLETDDEYEVVSGLSEDDQILLPE